MCLCLNACAVCACVDVVCVWCLCKCICDVYVGVWCVYMSEYTVVLESGYIYISMCYALCGVHTWGQTTVVLTYQPILR